MPNENRLTKFNVCQSYPLAIWYDPDSAYLEHVPIIECGLISSATYLQILTVNEVVCARGQ